MESNNLDEQDIQSIEGIKKDSQLLSIRAEQGTKELFYSLCEEKGYNKKRLLEEVLEFYLNRDKDAGEDEIKDFYNVNYTVLRDSVYKILSIFEEMKDNTLKFMQANKKWVEAEQSTLHDERLALHYEIDRLEKQNAALVEQKECAEKDKGDLQDTIEIYQKSIQERNTKINEYADQLQLQARETENVRFENGNLNKRISYLKDIENENITLRNQIGELLAQNTNHRETLVEKDVAVKILETKLASLENDSKEMQQRFKNEIQQLKEQHELAQKSAEVRIKKEISLEQKEETLDMKEKYNALQVEYVKTLRLLHDKELTIAELQRKHSDIKE